LIIWLIVWRCIVLGFVQTKDTIILTLPSECIPSDAVRQMLTSAGISSDSLFISGKRLMLAKSSNTTCRDALLAARFPHRPMYDLTMDAYSSAQMQPSVVSQ